MRLSNRGRNIQGLDLGLGWQKEVVRVALADNVFMKRWHQKFQPCGQDLRLAKQGSLE